MSAAVKIVYPHGEVRLCDSATLNPSGLSCKDPESSEFVLVRDRRHLEALIAKSRSESRLRLFAAEQSSADAQSTDAMSIEGQGWVLCEVDISGSPVSSSSQSSRSTAAPDHALGTEAADQAIKDPLSLDCDWPELSASNPSSSAPLSDTTNIDRPRTRKAVPTPSNPGPTLSYKVTWVPRKRKRRRKKKPQVPAPSEGDSLDYEMVSVPEIPSGERCRSQTDDVSDSPIDSDLVLDAKPKHSLYDDTGLSGQDKVHPGSDWEVVTEELGRDAAASLRSLGKVLPPTIHQRPGCWLVKKAIGRRLKQDYKKVHKRWRVRDRARSAKEEILSDDHEQFQLP